MANNDEIFAGRSDYKIGPRSYFVPFFEGHGDFISRHRGPKKIRSMDYKRTMALDLRPCRFDISPIHVTKTDPPLSGFVPRISSDLISSAADFF